MRDDTERAMIYSNEGGKNALESKEVEVEIEFLLSIKPIFDEFLTRFQKEEPMIHLLHSNCEKLLKTAMGR